VAFAAPNDNRTPAPLSDKTHALNLCYQKLTNPEHTVAQLDFMNHDEVHALVAHLNTLPDSWPAYEPVLSVARKLFGKAMLLTGSHHAGDRHGAAYVAALVDLLDDRGYATVWLQDADWGAEVICNRRLAEAHFAGKARYLKLGGPADD
jgi:hypothetical protein